MANPTLGHSQRWILGQIWTSRCFWMDSEIFLFTYYYHYCDFFIIFSGVRTLTIPWPMWTSTKSNWWPCPTPTPPCHFYGHSVVSLYRRGQDLGNLCTAFAMSQRAQLSWKTKFWMGWAARWTGFGVSKSTALELCWQLPPAKHSCRSGRVYYIHKASLLLCFLWWIPSIQAWCQGLLISSWCPGEGKLFQVYGLAWENTLSRVHGSKKNGKVREVDRAKGTRWGIGGSRAEM